ncbi:MAG: TrkH family potassium uptake protein [candidate division KSB1 bacterium]|nr:TrkH family potassium uptake protein [candidate division KSB1 bacterium]MDZ7391689.1 TrkH family potassium uptake protein [candidate division KSB1 bacterium]MDZ7413522.1 TrkH family potassium uptake protein [candidate division KSB1 bacterium]
MSEAKVDVAREKIERFLVLKLRPPRLVFASFVLAACTGALLLSLPAATKGRPLSPLDALFTATSAVCVTGLTVVDTGTRLSFLGQMVVLTLIQMGGLGIMTFSVLFMYLLTRRFSIRGRELLEETLSQRPLQHMGALLRHVFLWTFFLEAIGACLLTYRFWGRYPGWRAVYLGVFHAVSAFCNAGFGLFPDSLQAYAYDPLVNFTVLGLIVIGGLGFIVLFDLAHDFPFRVGRRRQAISLHTRLVLQTTAALIVVGMVAFLAVESFNTLRGMPWSRRLLVSLFQSVTARTAGFSTVETSRLTSATLMVLMALMFIGASPGSTGGGIKTSTFAVLVALVMARFRGSEEVNCCHRRLPNSIVAKAFALAVFGVVVVGAFGLALAVTELGLRPYAHSSGKALAVLFETVSAFGTVGLTTGLTPHLSQTGKFLIIVLMLVGRVGPLTLAIALGRGDKRPTGFRYVEESVLVG